MWSRMYDLKKFNWGFKKMCAFKLLNPFLSAFKSYETLKQQFVYRSLGSPNKKI